VRTDQVIQEDVEEELRWDPDLDGTDITVSVKDGIVTLSGFVKSLPHKYEAESAAKRIAGVRAVANDIQVRLPAIDERPDPEIARDAIAAIKSELPTSVPHLIAEIDRRQRRSRQSPSCRRKARREIAAMLERIRHAVAPRHHAMPVPHTMFAAAIDRFGDPR
jgi:hypothetical protein